MTSLIPVLQHSYCLPCSPLSARRHSGQCHQSLSTPWSNAAIVIWLFPPTSDGVFASQEEDSGLSSVHLAQTARGHKWSISVTDCEQTRGQTSCKPGMSASSWPSHWQLIHSWLFWFSCLRCEAIVLHPEKSWSKGAWTASPVENLPFKESTQEKVNNIHQL